MRTTPRSPASAAPRFAGSLATRTLATLSLLIAGIIVLMTAVSYFYTVSTLESHQLDQLRRYIVERGQREGEVFRLAMDNHAILKQELIRSLNQPPARPLLDRFDQLFVEHPDGVIRNRPNRSTAPDRRGRTSAAVSDSTTSFDSAS